MERNSTPDASTLPTYDAIRVVMTGFTAPLRLRLNAEALVSNWRWLDRQSGTAACGAAIKADGYGLGAVEVMRRLIAAGCRDFFVSNWGEVAALEPLIGDDAALSVLHGVRDEDMATALHSRARPVLNTPVQIARWKEADGGACDVMVDTGINRLGLDWRADVAAQVEGLKIETLMSHLASADDDIRLSEAQRQRFGEVAARVPASRASLANSAGICLGSAYAFDLTRPGLALFGGIPRGEAVGHIRQVVFPEAQILQRRRVLAGDTIGYNGMHRADRDMEIAVLNLGYADGYLRGFSGRGGVTVDGVRLPVVGRVSMDLIAVDVAVRPDVAEGDWLGVEYALPEAAEMSSLSQYELLTGLGERFDRVWN